MTIDSIDDTVVMIRMWREPGLPLDSTNWRGRVDVLSEQRRQLFVGADSLLRILNDCLSDGGPQRCGASDPPAVASAPESSSDTRESR